MVGALRGSLAAVLVAFALGGCGLGIRLPTSTSTSTSSPAPGASASAGASSVGTTSTPGVTSHEVPTPPGPEEHAPAARSAQAALRRFTGIYINWNARDVKRQLLALADDSVGQARTAMSLQAAQTGADPELRQAGIANQGTVEAVAPLAGVASDRYVVVTRERTTATNSSAYQGLAPAWHLTVATVTRRGAGWVISGWQPES